MYYREEVKPIYKITSVQIGSGHPLFEFCDNVTHEANNLYNATVFHERQCLFGLPKEPEKRYKLENEVIDKIAQNLDAMNAPKVKKDGTPKKTRASDNSEKKNKTGPKFKMPTAKKSMLSYAFLNELFRLTKNPDYNAPHLGKHSAQRVIDEAVQQFQNYFSSLKEYRKGSSRYTGEPKPPKYLKKGGMHTLTLSNEECDIRSASDITEDNRHRSEGNKYRTGLTMKDKDGNVVDRLLADHAYLKLPKTNILLDLGPIESLALSHQRLMEVKIIPHHGIFTISITLGSDMDKKTYEQQKKEREERKKKREEKKLNPIPPLPEGVPLRACSLDLGVDNLIALTNNVGAECLLFQGRVVKSINQYYNKRAAAIVSEQTKGTTEKFVPTPEFLALTLKRKNRIHDFMHKTAKTLLLWCKDHQINTIVIGHIKFWKQEANMGSRNNQNFVQIPFNNLINIITYLAEREGIRVIEQEESYTSKASFLDRDEIPVFDPDKKGTHTFSGVRGPTVYHGHPKVQPIDKATGKRKTSSPRFRGLYQAADGTIINSDLNGSANIGRKAFPDMYADGVGIPPDFFNVRVIRFPDEEKVKENHKKQRAAFEAKHPIVMKDEHGVDRHISKAARKRRRRKASDAQKVTLVG